MRLLKSTLALSLAAVMALSSCDSDDEAASPDTPPELPPVSSMEMNFSNFDDENTGGRLAENENWGRAVTHVAVWNTILAVNLAVPVSAFKAAVNQSAVYDSDTDRWIWSFDHNVVGRTYSSALTATLVDGGVEWEMYISEENGFQDVLWFSGMMERDASSGYWVVNKDGDNPEEFLRIDWEKQNDEVGTIKYTSIESDINLNGSYIEYSTSAVADFNRSYDIYIEETDNLTEIEWNTNDGNGRIKDPQFYGDDDYKCWDENFENTDC